MGSATLLLILGFLSCSLGIRTSDDNESSSVRSGRGLLADWVSTKLNFAAEKLGMIECTGADKYTGGHLFEHILGPDADFGGDYLCRPTCGGECVPNQRIGVAPISGYPFGCRCPQERCSSTGPVIRPLAKPVLKIVCVKDERCTCEGINRKKFANYQRPYLPRDIGYLCNWINIDRNQTVSYMTGSPDPSFQIHPTYSPIRWCSCCPDIQYMY